MTQATESKSRLPAPKQPGTAISLEKRAEELDAITNHYALKLREEGIGKLSKALIVGTAIQQLREAIAPMLPTFTALANNPLGFKTDRPPGKEQYAPEAVRDCIIAALLHGVYPVGNEMNIIAGSCYITKEGYFRKVREIPGLTDLEVVPGMAAVHNGQTVCRVAVRWKLNGAAGELKDSEGKPGRVFAIPTNQFSGPDAIAGKATRKALKAAYEQITHTEQTLPDGEVGEQQTQTLAAPATGTRTEALAAKLGGKTAANGGADRADACTLDEIEELTRHLGYEEASVKKLCEQHGAKALANLTPEQAHAMVKQLRIEVEDAANQGQS